MNVQLKKWVKDAKGNVCAVEKKLRIIPGLQDTPETNVRYKCLQKKTTDCDGAIQLHALGGWAVTSIVTDSQCTLHNYICS